VKETSIMKDLPASLLRALLAVVDTRSFSRAARELGTTQPAVSLQIRRLEKLVGATLLERTTRSVEPTETALRLLPIARELLRLQAIVLTRMDAPALSGEVRLGADESVALGLGLIETVRDFAHAWPQVELQLRIDDGTALHGAFEQGRLDLLLEHADAAAGGATIVSRERLLWYGRAMPATDDAPWPVIAPPRGGSLRRRSDAALAGSAARHRIVFEAPSLAMCIEAARRGLGIVALPADVGRAHALDRSAARGLPALGATSVQLRQRPGIDEATVALRNALRQSSAARRARGRTRGLGG